MGNDEKRIILAAKKKDLRAFEELLFLYEKRIYNYIFKLIGQKQDSEDLTQEVFIKLYKNLGSINPDKNFKTWLYTIATNTIYDWFRRKARRPELFIIDNEGGLLETSDTELTYKIADNDSLKQAFDNIKPIYKQVLLLFYYQGFSYQEIGEILSAPLNTVKTYIRRAKIALKEELEK